MSAAVAAAAASAPISDYSSNTDHHHRHHDEGEQLTPPQQQAAQVSVPLSRYESQKRRDWNTFGQYLKNHRPPLTLSRCSGAHVLEFLRYLDQFGKTKVHADTCAYFGNSQPPGPCPCPLRQAWGSLDALVGRLRAAFEENGGSPEVNPFGARAVRLYLREVRDAQSKARGIAYEKKKRRKNNQQQQVQVQPQEMVEDTAVDDVVSSTAVEYSSSSGYDYGYGHGYGYAYGYGGGFVQLSSSDGAAPTTAAASYFSY